MRHAYVPGPWDATRAPACDAEIDDDGRPRACGEPPAAEVHQLPFIVGENNPYGPDPHFALYPAPKGCAGWRLCHLVLQLRPHEYVRRFERRNLLSQPRWSAPAARAAAAKLAEEIGEGKVVLLGAKVCAAFRLDFEPFTVVRGKAAILPHPSGLSRAWNAPGAFDRARATVHQLLGATPA